MRKKVERAVSTTAAYGRVAGPLTAACATSSENGGIARRSPTRAEQDEPSHTHAIGLALYIARVGSTALAGLGSTR